MKPWERRRKGRIEGLIMKAEMGHDKSLRSLRIMCKDEHYLEELPANLRKKIVATVNKLSY